MIKNILVIFLVSANSILFSVNRLSNAVTGNWNATTSWAGGVIPTGNDSVIIVNGSNITLNVNAQIFSLQINTTATLSCSSNTLSLFGKFLNNGTFNANTGTVLFNGFVFKQPILGTTITAFKNVIINNTNGVSQYGVTAHPLETRFTGNIISNGVFNRNCTSSPTAFCHFMGTTVVTGTNSLIMHHVVIDAASTLNQQNPNIYITGNWLNNGAFTPNLNTINFDYTSCSTTTQSVNNGTSDFYNVRSAKTSTFTVIMANNTRIQNNFTNVLGTWSSQTFSLNVGGNFINSGVYNAGTGIVLLDGNANQNIDMGGSTLYNFRINKPGGRVYALSNVEVTNNANLLNGIIHTHPNISNPAVYELYINNNNPTTTLTGFSVNSFVIGRLRRQVTAAANTYNFPIGPMNVTPVKYRPIAHLQTSSGGASNVSMIGDSISFQGNKANWYVRIGSNAGNPIGNFLFTYNLTSDFPAGMPECAIMALRGAQPPPANWTYVLNTITPPTGATNGSITAAIPAALAPNSFILGEATPVISGSTICSGKTTTLTITSPTGFVQFDWWSSTTGGSIVQANSPNYSTPSLTTNTTYYIQTTASSCAGIRTPVTVTVNTLPTVNASVSNSVICYGNNTTLTYSGNASSFNWSGSVIDGTAFSPTSTASYTVTGTNATSGCTNTAVQTVTVNSLPLVIANASNSVICDGSFVTLTASGANSYSWSGGISNGVAFTPTTTSTYTVTGTDLNNCVNTAVNTITVNSLPTTTVSTTGSITCVTTTVNLNSSLAGANYTWTAPSTGAVIAGTNNQNAVGQGPGIYSLTTSNATTGCSISSTIQILPSAASPNGTVNPVTNSITCTNTIVPVSITTTCSPVSYLWSGPAISGSPTSSATTVSQGGTYNVTITYTTTGCSISYPVSVITNTNTPTLSVSATNSVLTCSTTNSTLTATPSTTDSPIWTIPGGSFAANPVTASTTGDYVATLLDGVNGCSVSQTITIVNDVTPPNANAGAAVVMPCNISVTTLLGTSTATDAVSYSWSGPNTGSVISGTNSATPTVTDTGVYTLTVTNLVTGCTATSTVNVSTDNVTADFTADPMIGEIPLNVNFTNSSTGANSYSWTFGNGLTSGSTNPSTVYNNTGTYTVMLVASSNFCSDTITRIIIAEDGFTIEIPNVFTPNGDGANDVFHIKTTGVKSAEGYIYNRWGQLLFSWDVLNNSWDGKATNGENCPDGTYYYLIKVIDKKDKEHIAPGYLLIAR
ncbi:MAG: gliding motility-associated C-terminal domain-containing protein [Burkholderiales bacterium]|nr:gliding motility-associated C-terminal domain-containing protein [Bacteroidia bacterium]